MKTTENGEIVNFKNWFRIDEDAEEKVNSMIDGEGYILFFKKDDQIYGADEDSRVVFAKIKNPDDELPENWGEEASFSAHNMNKMILGEPSEHVFSKKDFKEIKVIDREEAVEKLKKEAKKLGDKAFTSKFKTIDIRSLFNQDPGEAPNFSRTDER